MTDGTWIKELPAAITVCNAQGIILEMNDKAADVFDKDGGRTLIGTNVLACHPEPSRTLLEEMLNSQSKHVYTIEKNGVRKLIYQTPWFEQGKYGGFVELSLEIPENMPHFIRK
jgi:hypothetical protein